MGKLWPYLTPVAVAAGLLTLVSCQPIPEPTNSVDPRYALIRYLSSIHQLPGQHMTTTKVAPHTPGPWRVDETGEFIETAAPINFRGEYEHVCDFRNPSNTANARLIAASPEILEALKETLRALEQHLSDEAAEHNIKHVSALCACWENEVQRARAAIAKAEGR